MSLIQALKRISFLVCMPLLAQASALKDSIGAGFSAYADNGQVQVYSPTFEFFKRLGAFWMFGVKVRADGISAASIRNGSNITRVDAVTGASSRALFDDQRIAVTLLATHEKGENLLTFGAYYSAEKDYQGRALFINYIRQLNEENTAVGIGLSQSYDQWLPVFKLALPDDTRAESKIDFSLNQLITPKYSIQGVYSFFYAQGMLSSPYHFILQNDIAKFEAYPVSRMGHAFALKGVYLWRDDISSSFSYRYYFDDWNIVAHTVQVELLKDINDDMTSGLRLRYYTQSDAFFAKPIGTYTLLDHYYAVDYRMDAFDAIMIGVPFIYHVSDEHKLTASIDYYHTGQSDYIQNWYGVPNLDAVFMTLNYDFEY